MATQSRGVGGCLVMIVILAIAAGLIWSRIDAQSVSTDQQTATAVPPGALEITFAYGSEKQAWVEECTRRWLATQPRSASGKPLHLTGKPMGSGECMEDVAAGRIQADLVSPASDAFIRLGNARARAASGKDVVGRCENLVLSPVVLAMWKPMAEALGWPDKPVGWAEVLALVGNPKGWAAYGHPEWGAFRFGHTHPEYSNSGLLSVVATCYAAAGKTTDLRLTDLDLPETGAFLGGIERGVVHYGQSTGFFAKKLLSGGPGYLSAAVLYESSVVAAAGTADLPFPVVAIYPKEGTFWSDHPVGVVERDWVTPERRAAAQDFIRFLLAPAQQQLALQLGFRPADPTIALGAPIDRAHGVDPKQPSTVLATPETDVLDGCLRLWRKHKKTADVVLVFDRSGSMQEDGKITSARAGAAQFVAMLGDEDRLSLLPFNNQLTWLSKDAPLSQQRAPLSSQIQGLFPQGGTALYDAVAAAHAHLLPKSDGGSITAVVVLTDGEDTNSTLILSDLLAKIRGGPEGSPLRVFTIAYGKGANGEVLKRIAEASQGTSYSGTPQNVVAIFREISTFF